MGAHFLPQLHFFFPGVRFVVGNVAGATDFGVADLIMGTMDREGATDPGIPDMDL